jgi:hypothetical protein
MNATCRQFISALFCAVTVLTITFAMPAKTWGQGWISVNATIGPHVKTDQFINDTTFALMNGLPSYGLYSSIANNSSINITNLFGTTTGGSSLFYTISITNSTPFTLSQIGISIDDKFASFSATLGQLGLSYTKMGVGIGTNGTIYTSGNANTPVYYVFLVGVGRGLDITGLTVSDAENQWLSDSPFTTSGSASLGSLTDWKQFIIIDPIPESPALAISRLGNSIIVSWPNTGSNTLEQTSDLAGGNWTTNASTITTTNGTNSITLTPQAGSLFFRLKQ